MSFSSCIYLEFPKAEQAAGSFSNPQILRAAGTLGQTFTLTYADGQMTFSSRGPPRGLERAGRVAQQLCLGLRRSGRACEWPWFGVVRPVALASSVRAL